MGIYGRNVGLTTSDKQNLRQYMRETCKKAIEALIDPSSRMSEDEKRQYNQKIMAKLKRGKHLTSEEMNYLKIHNPVLYRTAMRVEIEKQRLKEQLKHCKSKEEANNIISEAICGIGDKDPDKEYLVAGIQETAKNFRKDSRYARLPDTIEQAKRKRTKRIHDFEDGEEVEVETFRDYSPIIEVIESLPTFDAVQ